MLRELAGARHASEQAEPRPVHRQADDEAGERRLRDGAQRRLRALHQQQHRHTGLAQPT